MVPVYQPSILKHDTLVLPVLIVVPEFLVQILEETAGGEKQVLAEGLKVRKCRHCSSPQRAPPPPNTSRG